LFRRMLSESHPEEGVVEVPRDVRESYIRAVSAIPPHDDLERDDIAATLRWLNASEHLNKPHNMDEHLGVFAIVLSENGSHTFLLKHRKAGLWLPPGGHV